MSVYLERQIQALQDAKVNIEDGNDYGGLRRLVIKRNLVITLAIAALRCNCRACVGQAESEVTEYKTLLAQKFESSDPKMELIQELLGHSYTQSYMRLIPVDQETIEISKRVASYASQRNDLETA